MFEEMSIRYSMIWIVGVLRYHALGKCFKLLQHVVWLCAMGVVVMLEFHTLWM